MTMALLAARSNPPSPTLKPHQPPLTLLPLTWSRLPIELVHEILLFLASTSARQTYKLRLVSRSLNLYLAPLLFRDLVFTTPERITRFSTALLPRPSWHSIPALLVKKRIKQHQTMPVDLTQYDVESLTLVVNKRLPSVEVALASVAPMFNRVRKLAITGDQLAANAFWLREHPIHPRKMMIMHHGRPALINFFEPVFQYVSHLYTSSLWGHHNRSSVLNLPRLTHLAVCTRAELPLGTVAEIAAFLKLLLARSGTIQKVVLSISWGNTLPPSSSSPSSSFGPSNAAAAGPISVPYTDPWLTALNAQCLTDKRFYLLPFHHMPRMEWVELVRGRDTIWDCAEAWRAMGVGAAGGGGGNVIMGGGIEEQMKKAELVRSLRHDQAVFQQRARCPEGEWELDLVQREGYHPPGLEDDRGEAWV